MADDKKVEINEEESENTIYKKFDEILNNVYEKINNVGTKTIELVIDYGMNEEDFSNQIEVAQSYVQGFKDDIGASLLPVAQNVIEIFNDVACKLQQTFDDPVVQDGINNIVQDINELISKIGQLVKDSLPYVIDAIKWIGEHSNEVEGAILAIASAIGTIRIGILIKDMLDKFSEFSSKVKDAGSVLKVVKDIFISLGGGPITLIIVGIAALVGAFVYLWNTSEGFRDFWIGLWENICSVFTIVSDFISTFFNETLPEAISFIVEFLSELGVNIYDTIVNSINTIYEFITETIPQIISEVIEWFMKLPNNIVYGLGYILGSIVNWGISVYEYLTTNIPIWISSVGEWFAQLPGVIWTWLCNVVTNIINWGISVYEYLTTNIPIWISSIGQWFAQLPGVIWTWLCNAVSNVINWGSNLATAGYQAACSLVESVVNTIESIPERMISIGRNIVEGIWNGISGAIGWIKGKIGDFKDSFVDGFKDALGIHSPSRIMRDMIGKYIPQGIGVGIDMEMPNLQDQINNNIKGLYNQLRGTVDTETARTTVQVATATNYAINRQYAIDENEISSGNINKMVHTIVNIDGKKVAEATSPYMDIELGNRQSMIERGGC